MAENLVITEPECLPAGLCFMRVRLGTLKLNLCDCLASCTQRAMGWCAGGGTAPSHRWWGSSSWQSIAPAVPSCSPSPGNQPFFCSQEDEIAINKYNSKEKLWLMSCPHHLMVEQVINCMVHEPERSAVASDLRHPNLVTHASGSL